MSIEILTKPIVNLKVNIETCETNFGDTMLAKLDGVKGAKIMIDLYLNYLNKQGYDLLVKQDYINIICYCIKRFNKPDTSYNYFKNLIKINFYDNDLGKDKQEDFLDEFIKESIVDFYNKFEILNRDNQNYLRLIQPLMFSWIYLMSKGVINGKKLIVLRLINYKKRMNIDKEAGFVSLDDENNNINPVDNKNQNPSHEYTQILKEIYNFLQKNCNKRPEIIQYFALNLTEKKPSEIANILWNDTTPDTQYKYIEKHGNKAKFRYQDHAQQRLAYYIKTFNITDGWYIFHKYHNILPENNLGLNNQEYSQFYNNLNSLQKRLLKIVKEKNIQDYESILSLELCSDSGKKIPSRTIGKNWKDMLKSAMEIRDNRKNILT